MILIEKLVSLIAPSNCLVCGQEGQVLCESCTPGNLTPFGGRCFVCGRLSELSKTCPKCARLGGPRHVWINVLYDGAAERIVEEFKYDCVRPAGRFMAAQMAKSSMPFTDFLITSVPTASTRRRERGFDHAALLAQEVAKIYKADYRSVIRRLDQVRQVGANRAQRLRQAEASYKIKNPRSVRGKYIVIVDDVTTTGATLQAIARLLRKAGARRVDAMVFAKRL